MNAGQRRIAVGLEYDGARYAGWQLQAGLATIQGEVQRALAAVAAHDVRITCAGRTDAAVHATWQVAHFDTGATRPLRGWVLGANSLLPSDIALNWAVEVDGDFDARRSALSRSYRYCILQRATRPALLRDRVCWARTPLDVTAMHEAAQCLIGEHDFSAFRAAECQAANAIRRIDSIGVSADGPLVTIEVTANAFVHHMVRNIAGTLLEVGNSGRAPASVAETLASRDRRRAGITAPACGLYLVAVRYPPAAGLPEVLRARPWAMIGPASGGTA